MLISKQLIFSINSKSVRKRQGKLLMQWEGKAFFKKERRRVQDRYFNEKK